MGLCRFLNVLLGLSVVSADVVPWGVRVHLAGVVGVKPMPGFTGPKLLWLSRHEADNRRRIACVLAPKDYLRLALCGERATDMSDAAGSWLLDEATRAWSAQAIAACAAAPAWSPRLFEGSQAVGAILPTIAEELGLPISLVGMGEGLDDLEPFDAEAFARALFE